MTSSQHVYEVRPRKDHRGVDLLSDALPFGRLWYDGPNAIGNAMGYAMHYSRSANAVIRVYDTAGNVIETHEHAGDFKEVLRVVPFHLGEVLGKRPPERHEPRASSNPPGKSLPICVSNTARKLRV
jgi:hypothetical protein